MSSPLTKNWLPAVDARVLVEDEIPLLGATVDFDFDAFTKALEGLLQIKDLALNVQEWRWRDTNELFEGIGKDPKVLQISLFPLSGLAYFALSDADLKKWLTAALKAPAISLPGEIEEGFFEYMAAVILKILETSAPFKNLSPRLLKDRSPPTDLSLTLDVGMQDFHGRIFLSGELRRSWRRHQNAEEVTKRLSSPIPMHLCVSMGWIHLTLQEWRNVQLGDFLLLNRRDPLLVSHKNMLLFHAEEQTGKIKISDKRPKDMAKEPEENPKFFLGEDEEFFVEDEELSKVLKEEFKPTTETKESPGPAKKERGLSPDQIPLHIRLEIGHLSLTAKQVLELRPGNELSLEKEIDNQVNLLVGGKCIGRGELIQIGDALGVRILEL